MVVSFGAFGSVTTSVPFIKAGKLRALALTTSKRSPVSPDVPTFQEAGFPKYETSTWNMVMAPSKTPAAVVAKLNGALLAVCKDAGFTKRLADIGAISLHMTPSRRPAMSNGRPSSGRV